MIYIVEDDSSIRELVAYTLNSQGMEAEGFECPSAFFKALDKKMPDLVLLDIMLPEMDGLSVLRKLKGTPACSRLPVIMLTAKGSEYDTVMGLDSGADDYIPKPFSTTLLLARMEAVLRRAGMERTETVTAGAVTVAPEQRTAAVDGAALELTRREFDLLYCFVCNQGRTLSREQILDHVWGFDFEGDARTVDTHVKNLRLKLGEHAGYIQTVYRVGYKFEAEP